MKTVNNEGWKEKRRTTLDPDDLAVRALAYFASDAERLGRFLALTGFDPSALRAAATQPGFATAILSYLGSDDTLLVAFAAAQSLDPEQVGAVVRHVASPPEDR